MQTLAPFPETVAAEAMQVGLDVLLLGITSACVLLTLAFVAALAASVVAEIRKSQPQRNGLPRRA